MSGRKKYWSNKSYCVEEDSVDKALDLFINLKIDNKRNRLSTSEDSKKKYSNRCSSVIKKTKMKTAALSFSPSYALIEMRMCLMKHDWCNLQRLLLIILELSSRRKIVLWRYVLTILIHSPMNSLEEFVEFLWHTGIQYNDAYYVMNCLIFWDILNDDLNKKSIKV